MRGTTDEGLALGSHLRIGLRQDLEGEVAIRWESLLQPKAIFTATVDHQVTEAGVTLTAQVDGLTCVVGWSPAVARIVTTAAPELSEDFVNWCRHVHMNLVNAHCALAALAMDEFAGYRILAAASAKSPCDPGQAIELMGAEIASLCETHGFDRLWCTTSPTSAMDDINTVEVTLVYERQLGELDEGSAELERAIATLIGFRVRLTWREPTTSTTHHALKLGDAREVWKAAK